MFENIKSRQPLVVFFQTTVVGRFFGFRHIAVHQFYHLAFCILHRYGKAFAVLFKLPCQSGTGRFFSIAVFCGALATVVCFYLYSFVLLRNGIYNCLRIILIAFDQFGIYLQRGSGCKLQRAVRCSRQTVQQSKIALPSGSALP